MTYPSTPGYALDETSKEAARLIEPDAGKIEARVLRFFTVYGPHTCAEIEDGLNLSHQTASARITKLVNDGKLVKTDQTRRTRTGRKARVYAVAPEGTPPKPARRSEIAALRADNAEMVALLWAIRRDGSVTLETHDRLVTILEKHK